MNNICNHVGSVYVDGLMFWEGGGFNCINQIEYTLYCIKYVRYYVNARC